MFRGVIGGNSLCSYTGSTRMGLITGAISLCRFTTKFPTVERDPWGAQCRLARPWRCPLPLFRYPREALYTTSLTEVNWQRTKHVSRLSFVTYLTVVAVLVLLSILQLFPCCIGICRVRKFPPGTAWFPPTLMVAAGRWPLAYKWNTPEYDVKQQSNKYPLLALLFIWPSELFINHIVVGGRVLHLCCN